MALVISRKVGEAVVLNKEITITVTKLSGSRVSLLFVMPDEVHLLRGELRDDENGEIVETSECRG